VTAELEALGARVDRVLEKITLPAILIDRSGRVRWQNRACIELLGDHRGAPYADLIAPDYRRESLERFTGFIFGADISNDFELAANGASGLRIRVAVTTVPICDDDRRVVAILTIAKDSFPERRSSAIARPLPTRQRQTLQLLAAGRSTNEIAAELGVSRETARNHIRGLLRSLEVHSRLEAVARGRELGLV